MTDTQRILSLEVSKSKNSENFVEILNNSLQNEIVQLKKRIVSCAIELIQNTLIHNTEESIFTIIEKQGTRIILSTHQQITHNAALNIIEQINIINGKNSEGLKSTYRYNLENSNGKQNTGNGLIVCRMKSDRDISSEYIENQLYIKLIFEKE